MLIISFIVGGCVSPATDETPNEHVEEHQIKSINTTVSDSTSFSEEMKKDTTKIVPKTEITKAKINKQIQRPILKGSNNSADTKKDVTTNIPKPQKNPVYQKPPEVNKPPAIAQVPQKKGPRIYFPNKNHNYGKINEGKKINHKFKFINTGDDSLLINNLDVSCGCTVPKHSSKKVGPGGTGYIDVEYDSKGKFMNQESSIYVYSNSRISPTVELMLTGYVRVPLAKDKKNEEKDTVKTPLIDKKPDDQKLEEPKKPIINKDTIKKKIKEVFTPKIDRKVPKDTTSKKAEVKTPVEDEDDW